MSFNDENDSGRVRDACGENEEKIVYNLFENDETYAVATGPEPDYRSLPPGAGRRVHRVGLYEGDRSLGNVDQDQRIPHDLRVRLSDSGQHGLFDLAVRRRDDDGLHAALQGAYPAGVDLRSGVDAFLYDPYLFECDVHPGRGLRLFR